VRLIDSTGRDDWRSYVGSPDAIKHVLFRVPVDGGTPTRIADASAYAVDATHVYWADDRGTVYRLTK
jgi:hypothetical protein